MGVLKDKNVVLGITGSIAAYKAAELTSRLVKSSAAVEVVMTKAATEFVNPLTFQSIAARPVVIEMFELLRETDIAHVSLARRADIVVIAPATANTIAKLAAGLADNTLTATALATTAPIIVAPAMETRMYKNPATQESLARLRQRGVTIIEPGYGQLASGTVGVGRLAEVGEIMGAIRMVLGREGDLASRKVVVTAGGTQEPIDPVRFIGNPSSGKMGYSLAEAARDSGAAVTLIAGPTALSKPVGVDFIAVRTTEQMHEAVLEAIPSADILIMAAAVADYRPASIAERKIKKVEERWTLELVRNPDILADVANCELLKVGFAAETEDLIENARAKLTKKRLDLIVANPVPASFGGDTIQATLITRAGKVTELPPLPKSELAELVLDRVVELLLADVHK